MSAFVDKQIKCLECGKDFTYTAAEQELHKSLGYQNEPKRCNPCREAKRQRRPGGGAPRGEGQPAGAAAPAPAPAAAGAPPAAPRPPQSQGQRPPQGGGGRRDGGRNPQNSGPRPPRDGRNSNNNNPRNAPPVERVQPVDPGFIPREFHLAICAECGKEAQLPFKPQGDRPVYCIDCFAQKRTG